MNRLALHVARPLAALIAAAAPLFSQAPAEPYAEVLDYEYGKPRAALFEIEGRIRSAPPEELRAIEAKLLATIRSPAATVAAREWACRQLRLAGSERAAPILAPLLSDPKLHTAARWALQSIPGPAADEAIREVLPRLEGELKAGALLTLGARRDRKAVPLAAQFASDPEAKVAEAAVYALGEIGGVEALRALEGAKVPAGLEGCRSHATLLVAERFLEEGERTRAAEVYRRLFEGASGRAIRAGALRGLLLSGAPGAAEAASAFLRGSDPGLRAAAAKLVCEVARPEVLERVFSDLGSYPPPARIELLDLVSAESAFPAVARAASEGEDEVRAAALAAAGRLGGASSAGLLLEAASRGTDAVRAAARGALRALRGGGVDEALLEKARSGETAVRREALRALAARGSAGASRALLEAARDAEPSIRVAALGALAELADAAALPGLVGILAEAKGADERAAAEAALAASARRAGDKDSAAATLASAMAGRPAEVRAALVRALAAAGSARAFEAVRAALEDSEVPVREEALRALEGWTDASALEGLIAAAREARGAEVRSAALRSVARLAALPGVPAERSSSALSAALELAPGAAEKKAILSALSKAAHPRALEAALAALAEPELEVEAASAALAIAKALRVSEPGAADAARAKILEVCRSPVARQLAEASQFLPAGMVNIAGQGTATSPDGIDADGASGGDRAAIDGDPNTYWDEEDGKDLYRLVVELPQARRIAAVSILGYEHHQYAPRDFEILLDGVVVKKVEGAQYDGNFLVVRFDPVTAKTVELKITGCYGRSPAIRELGIYRPAGR